MDYLLYFFAGLLIAGIDTYHIKNVGSRNAVHAATSSFIAIVVSMYVVFDIITNLHGLYGIIVYAFGDWIGVYSMTKSKRV